MDIQSQTAEQFRAELDTPLGHMVAIFNEHVLCFLQFADSLTPRNKQWLAACSAFDASNSSAVLPLLQQELAAYFAGTLREFTVPLVASHGTPFQQRTWAALAAIPYGTTRSYAAIACAIEAPTAHRAVARANAENPIALIVPCHRVIRSDGAVSGYRGSVVRKVWLLGHEGRGAC